MAAHQKLSPGQIDDIRRRRLEGESVRSLAREFEVSEGAIRLRLGSQATHHAQLAKPAQLAQATQQIKPGRRDTGEPVVARHIGGKPSAPTDEQRRHVELLAGLGVPLEQIAALTEGVSYETLLRCFRTEIQRGRARANSKVAQTLYRKATEGDVTAMIWWTKTQMKWSETMRHELTTQQTQRGWTAEELEQFDSQVLGLRPQLPQVIENEPDSK